MLIARTSLTQNNHHAADGHAGNHKQKEKSKAKGKNSERRDDAGKEVQRSEPTTVPTAAAGYNVE